MDILLAMPMYGGLTHAGALRAGLVQASEQHSVQLAQPVGSLLPKTFNMAWCAGLELAEAGEIELFAMLHDDVMPEAGWLDKLVAELDRTGADVLSCVVPIKDQRGITSTAIAAADPADEWHCEKRLSMHEVMRLPETFTAADCGYPRRALLVNTGCWVCRIRDPRFRQTNPNGSLSFCFRFQSRVLRRRDGQYEIQNISEDWDFSRWLYRHGFDVRATRVVSLEHFALAGFPNDRPWGSCASENDPLPIEEETLCVSS